MKEQNIKNFINNLDHENKDECVLQIMNLLESGATIKEIYENYLIPGLAGYECNSEIEEICIWKEHTRTSIIRTILEATYPYLIKQKKPSIGKTVLVACPQQEYHEIGAIIATNFFILEGFDAKYIGANTPNEQVVSAVRILNPDFIALSITNYYNLVVTKKLTEQLFDNFSDLGIIIGGQATKNEGAMKQLKYHHIILSHEDIIKFKEGLV